ncbi:MAG: hypothetical protein IJQ38_00655 [Bacteroidaceae bacterium]|nr:hypothetical protein [Bacteroidaceae bacterium]
MNNMNDSDLDTLIRETMERRTLLTDLNRLILADVRRRARRAWLRKWARIIVFSFGLPLVLILWLACAHLYIYKHGATGFTLFLMVWPTLALATSTVYALKTFSPEEV